MGKTVNNEWGGRQGSFKCKRFDAVNNIDSPQLVINVLDYYEICIVYIYIRPLTGKDTETADLLSFKRRDRSQRRDQLFRYSFLRGV